MGMVKLEKLGAVSIKKQDRDGALYLSYWSSINRTTITRKVATSNINTARKEAAKLDKEIRGNKAPMVIERVGIREAMDQAILHSRSKNDHHRKNLGDNARYFTEFLASKYPGLSHWDDVRYQHLQGYIESLKARGGITPKTAKNYASVVALTSNHMHRIDSDRYRRIEVVHPWLASGAAPVKRYLNPHDALDLLEFAKARKSPNALIAMALGAFVGLNLWEIARMRVRDVDMKAFTVTVRESKNVHRNRTIPVLPLVIDALRERVRKLDPDAYLIEAPGTPTDQTIAKNLTRRLLPAARIKYGRLYDIAPKDLRKTFINLLAAARVQEQWIEAFIGHAAYSTIRKHYLDNTVAQLQEHVIVPLQAMMIQIEDSVPGKKPPKTRAELIASGEIKSDEDEMEDRIKDLMGWPE